MFESVANTEIETKFHETGVESCTAIQTNINALRMRWLLICLLDWP